MREKILKPNEFIEAFDSGVEINEQTLLNYAYSGEVIEEGENRRWSRTVTSIAKINGRYFKILWEEGLTEYQDNSVWDAPIEVNKGWSARQNCSLSIQSILLSGLKNLICNRWVQRQPFI